MKNEKRNNDYLIGKGITLGGLGLQSIAGGKVRKAMKRDLTDKDVETLDNLIKKYKPEGTAYFKDLDAGEERMKTIKELLHKKNITFFDKFIDKTNHKMGPATVKSGIYASNVGAPEIIAHEIGHNRYMNGLDGKAGQIVHKLMDPANIGSILSGPIAGIISGVRKANLEDKGLQESKLNKHAAWVVPAITQLPILAGETAASLNGIKKLESLGAFANKAEKLAAQKNLANALETYLGGALMKVGGGLAARGLSYRIRKAMLKKKKERAEEKEKEYSGYEPTTGYSYINAQVRSKR